MKKKIAVIAITMTAMVSILGCSVSDTPEESGKATEVIEDGDQKLEITEDEVILKGTAEEDTDTDTETGTRVEQINIENTEGSLVYVRHELTKDYNGADAVRIYFTYTNKSAETKTAQSTFYPQVFQNGIECGFTAGDFMDPNEAESNLSKELMKDSSLEVAFIFTLQDITNPVVLKVTDQSPENLFDDICQEQELSLQ